jgi:hypothetical protein
VAVIAALIQAWITYDWIVQARDHCDYPDGCLSTWFPRAFFAIKWLWVVTVLAGTASLARAAIARRPRADLVVLAASLVAAFLGYVSTPMVQGWPGHPGRVPGRHGLLRAAFTPMPTPRAT